MSGLYKSSQKASKSIGIASSKENINPIENNSDSAISKACAEIDLASSIADAKKRKPNTNFDKASNEALLNEILNPSRLCEVTRIGHGQHKKFWEEVEDALLSYPDAFPGESFPSFKVCQKQFDFLLAAQRKKRETHKWESGSTEELDETSQALEDILGDMDAIAQLSELDKQKMTDRENEASEQENAASNSRATPMNKGDSKR